MLQGFLRYIRELKDFLRLTGEEFKGRLQVVFYSESAMYFQYFEGYIDYLLKHSDMEIVYLTSDFDDPILKREDTRLVPFYFNHFLPKVIENLDCKALVMSMPDLGTYHVRRSKHPVEHVFSFHSVGSYALGFPKGSLDQFDTVFCVGPHDHDEIKQAESVYGLRPKNLVKVGYYWLEKVYLEHQKYLQSHTGPKLSGRRRILIAPTWFKGCLLETSAVELVAAVRELPFDFILRPHPEFVKRYASRIERLRADVSKTANVSLELNLGKRTSISEADVLITDRSAIAFEYAFGTERPVLFIDTPPRIDNPAFEDLGFEPLEWSARSQIGLTVPLARLDQLGPAIEELLSRREQYRERIVALRSSCLFHWQRAGEIGGQYLLARCATTANPEPGANSPLPIGAICSP